MTQEAWGMLEPWTMRPQNDRGHLADAFIEANDSRVAGMPDSPDRADSTWRILLEACGGDIGLALKEAEAALRRRRLS